MIPFFRKLRKQLADDNKPLKYLRYAIGEIVLVVIGILIALQINAWNAKRIDVQKEKEYINRLTSELKKEISSFKDLQTEYEDRMSGLERIVSIWESNDPTILDSTQYKTDFFSPNFIIPWYSEPVTWTQLQFTGDLSLIKNREIADALFVFYEDVKKVSENFDQSAMAVVLESRIFSGNKVIHALNAHDLGSTLNDWRNGKESKWGPKFYEQAWNVREELMVMYKRLMVVCSVQIVYFKSIIDSGEKVLKKLEASQGNTSENDPMKTN